MACCIKIDGIGRLNNKFVYIIISGEQPWLYYANRRDIRRLRVDSRYMEIIIEDTRNSIALDVDYNDDVIFWTDGAKEQIHRYLLFAHFLIKDK